MSYPIRAIHFNHHWHAEADAWQEHCQRQCQHLDIPLTCVDLHLPDKSENTARIARYQNLQHMLRSKEILLTAHHRGDQAETMLQKILRGTGLAGMGGIRPMRQYGPGWLARPLLAFSAADLKNWLRHNDIDWLEDPSNENTRYARNYLRHTVLPGIQSRWPQAESRLAATAEHAQSAWDLLHHFYQQHGPMAGQPLPVNSFSPLPANTHTTWLALWLNANQQHVPESARLKEFLRQCLYAADDKAPELSLGHIRIRCWHQHIYLVNNQPVPANWESPWDGITPLILPAELGTLRLKTTTTETPLALKVRFYQGGERILLPGQKHHKRLKKIFQQQSVPPWQRRLWPLVFSVHSKQPKLLAVGDWLMTPAAPFEGIIWQRSRQDAPTAVVK